MTANLGGKASYVTSMTNSFLRRNSNHAW